MLPRGSGSGARVFSRPARASRTPHGGWRCTASWRRAQPDERLSLSLSVARLLVSRRFARFARRAPLPWGSSESKAYHIAACSVLAKRLSTGPLGPER